MKIKDIDIDKLRIVGVSSEEAETIIVIPRNSDQISISCYDSVTLTKMKKLVKSGVAKLTSVCVPSGDHEPFDATEVSFEMPKKALSFRRKIESTMSEEQRAAASERMKMLQLKRKSK